MTWSAVGSPVTGFTAGGTVSVTVNPTAIGDVLVASVGVGYFVIRLPVGGGVTMWQPGGQSDWEYLGTIRVSGWFFGVVTTTGAQTMTLDTFGSYDAEIIVQQFHWSGLPGVVQLDTGSGASGATSSSGGDGNPFVFPSVVPSTSLKSLFVSAMDSGSSGQPTITLTGGAAITGPSYMNLVYLYDALAPNAYQPTAPGGFWWAISSGFLIVVPSASTMQFVMLL